MEMEMWTEMAMQMAMEMWMEMVMEMVIVIFGARKARSELRFASKRFLTSDFEALEASGAPKDDQGRPKKFPNAPKKIPRSPQEVPKTRLGGALGALGGPKSSPSHDPRYIHRFFTFQEPSRRSPRGCVPLMLAGFHALLSRPPGGHREPPCASPRGAGSIKIHQAELS